MKFFILQPAAFEAQGSLAESSKVFRFRFFQKYYVVHTMTREPEASLGNVCQSLNKLATKHVFLGTVSNRRALRFLPLVVLFVETGFHLCNWTIRVGCQCFVMVLSAK